MANVTEKTPMGDVAVDVYTRLIKERIIWLGDKIDAKVANTIMAQLLFLENDDSSEDIYMYINAPGGSVDAALGIYDTMQFIQPDIVTICAGGSYGMASLILAAGTKGKRYALPNAIIHHRSAKKDISSYAPEVPLSDEFMNKVESRVNYLLAQHTEQPVEKIQTDFQGETYFTAEEAIQYGFIDEIITRNPEL